MVAWAWVPVVGWVTAPSMKNYDSVLSVQKLHGLRKVQGKWCKVSVGLDAGCEWLDGYL